MSNLSETAPTMRRTPMLLHDLADRHPRLTLVTIRDMNVRRQLYESTVRYAKRNR